MTKAEVSRKIAEKLNWIDEYSWTPNPPPYDRVFDPFNDERSSARLLDAMPRPQMELLLSGHWYFTPKVDALQHEAIVIHHTDRKTAIALAAKAWLGIEGEL